MVEKVAIILAILASFGCGLMPVYRRAQPDYLKAANMLLYGGSKKMIQSDWGQPDKTEVLEDGVETWTYKNRQDGRTFIFYFNKKGKLIGSNI